MEQEKIKELADYVHQGEKEKREIAKITAERYPNLTIAEGYLIQEELLNQKKASGQQIIGYKMGLTSEAKLQQMNVTDPIYGYLFDYMVVDEGTTVSLADYIHPRVEPEIGFVLKEELKGPNVTKEDVLAATAYIFPAIEIIDSRYLNFDFTMADVVADNTSAAGVVLGTTISSASDADLSTVGVTLAINGKIRAVGAGAAVLGHPAESVARLANMLAAKGQVVPANKPILTGGITAAEPLASGDYVSVTLGDNLGDVHFFVK